MYNGNRVALIEDAVDVADAVLIPFISFEAMMDIANACHLWRITVFPQPPIQREIDHFAHAIQRPNRLIWFLLLLFVSVIQHSIEFHFHFWSIPSDWVSNNKKKKKNKSKKYQCWQCTPRLNSFKFWRVIPAISAVSDWKHSLIHPKNSIIECHRCCIAIGATCNPI